MKFNSLNNREDNFIEKPRLSVKIEQNPDLDLMGKLCLHDISIHTIGQ